jgi:hypothetical protein
VNVVITMVNSALMWTVWKNRNDIHFGRCFGSGYLVSPHENAEEMESIVAQDIQNL